MSKETTDNPGVIAFPPAMYIGTLFIGLFIHFVFPIYLLPRLLAILLGGTTTLVGLLTLFSAICTMKRAETAVNPALPTTAIVSDGVFAFSRNPVYVSFNLLYLGIAFFFNSLWAVLLLLPLIMVVQIGVIRREEIYLERKFGDQYLSYKARVRRWV